MQATSGTSFPEACWPDEHSHRTLDRYAEQICVLAGSCWQGRPTLCHHLEVAVRKRRSQEIRLQFRTESLMQWLKRLSSGQRSLTSLLVKRITGIGRLVRIFATLQKIWSLARHTAKYVSSQNNPMCDTKSEHGLDRAGAASPFAHAGETTALGEPKPGPLGRVQSRIVAVQSAGSGSSLLGLVAAGAGMGLVFSIIGRVL